ncbi:hypothetical protein GCM10007425_20790 [Lysinibacillus alkalisoli]|uniref:UPF0145 protein GCM10007425_20790 n=1 Tax=Lysinibacillus alkalisoli TaxID=1911548 RepID=A0A917G7N4_9BACI|nr:heavy metal-binding domain-containing protein [Lysinibacillus alkalisoli]GGG26085.1 hypothetical protein GCM10007425_20790 [Lysinibacillus alkalisoli]
MLIVTSEQVPHYKIIATKGVVYGITVRARGIGRDIVATFKGFVGGEIDEYTEMLEQARGEAMQRMEEHAKDLGANAIVMMRFDSGEIGQNMSEIIAYGTAVVVEPV